MKRILKVIIMLASLLLVISFGSRICASEATPVYTVSEEGGEYLLSVYNGTAESPILRSEKIGEIVGVLERTSSDARVLFRDVSISESFALTKKYTVSGSLALSDGAILSIDSNVTFSELNMEILSGKVRIKEGSLEILNSEIHSQSAESITLDYSSVAVLRIVSGAVVSDGVAIKNTLGRVDISGGTVKSQSDYAIENSSTLVLSGKPEIKGRELDVNTFSEITLANSGAEFLGNVKIMYQRSFSEGEIKCVFYSASESSIKGIEFFDKNKNQLSITHFDSFEGINETNFSAVYLPYKVNFYSDKTLIKTAEIVHGIALKAPKATDKVGYKFLGYVENEGGTTLYDFATDVNKSFNLYAKYELLPPSFELFSFEFKYDGASHLFGIENLSHPLIENAIVNYIWYKDGSYFSNTGPKIALKSVSDSGKYYAEVTFTYGQDTVKIKTLEVDVNIKKQTVSPPNIPPKEYNGEKQFPDVFSTTDYSVLCEGGSEVGKYVVKLELTDTVNTEFLGGAESVNLEFEITKGKNFWTDGLSVFDAYEGAAIDVDAAARFGDVKFLFSDKADGVYSDLIPSLVGKYFVIAFVEESENYTELKSAPVSFSIIEDGILGLSVCTPPEKVKYTAFDSFLPKGLSILVTYSSGRSEIIGTDKFTLRYQTAPNLRYGDTAVIVSYLDKSLSVAVSVEKACYDLSGFSFSDTQVFYDSENKSILPFGELPIGDDGIPLSYSVVGGGKNVGSYSVILSFSSDSKNYEIPSSVEAVLEILPKEVKVHFENTEFTYDGKSKCPTAYYIDIYGRKVQLSVSGARSFAGEYTAVASGEDSNYKLVGASKAYKINKADYELSGVYWSEADYTYDGNIKDVYIAGLPEGVEVIGYSDNKAQNAGKYSAKASVLYDENNYNAPEIPTYVWEIKKADYDLSRVEILDTVPIYSGKINYPEIKGSMPVGIDGIALEYSFVGGATHVSEGKVLVEVRFFTESKNYNIPEKKTAYVEVKPLGITVLWENREFTYNMSEQSPKATSQSTGILVLGAGKNAGKYTATAISVDSDYYVINGKIEYEILKAENAFLEMPKIEDVFEGREPEPTAKALGGTVEFVYYTEGGERLSEYPKSCGNYLVVAESDGGGNYLPIKSEPVRFKLIKVVPVSIFIRLHKTEFFAFERLSPEDFTLCYKNNDGSETRVAESIKIEYEAGEGLLFGKGGVTVSVGGFKCELSLAVKKADYDLSGVFWSESEFVYDGTEKSVVLLGLPSGVYVKEYAGNFATGAGSYRATAILSYDEENCNPPKIDSHSYVIRKQIVPFPVFEALTYNGKEQSPSLSGPLYSAVFEKGIDSGRYEAKIELCDSDNYVLENNSDEAVLYYEILPRKVAIELSGIDKYLLSKMPKPSYSVILGEIISGDDLRLSFIYNKDSVDCISENPNYDVTVTPGELVRHNFVSKNTVFVFFLIFLLLVTVTLIILVFVLRKKEIIHYFARLKCRFSPVAKTEEALLPKELPKESTSDEIPEIKIPIDAEKADALLSDTLAKELLHKENIAIETEGSKKRIINVDTLSDSFEPGEKIDVNRLKEANLVPYDTAYIKVLARGVIDKSLTVYANDFSLSAVKMIALSGGEAVKVVTVKKKKEN